MGGGYADEADKPKQQTDQEGEKAEVSEEAQVNTAEETETSEAGVENNEQAGSAEENLDQFETRQDKIDQMEIKPVDDVLNHLDDFPPADQGTLQNIALKNVETPDALNQFAENQDETPELVQQLAGSRSELLAGLRNGSYL